MIEMLVLLLLITGVCFWAIILHILLKFWMEK